MRKSAPEASSSNILDKLPLDLKQLLGHSRYDKEPNYFVVAREKSFLTSYGAAVEVDYSGV